LIHQQGIVYAKTSDGIELPIVDITTQHFAVPSDPTSLIELTEQYKLAEEKQAKTPVFLQRLFMKLGSRRSQILRALIDPEESFLGGLTTYIMKLGPTNLPDDHNTSIDQRIVSSPHARFVCLRLQQCAMLLADGLEPLLLHQPDAPLHLVNIGGGPAMDSINALLLLVKRYRELLARPIHIHVCDLDSKGPAFAANVLTALSGPDLPFAGLAISFYRTPYDWNDTSALETLLANIVEPNAIIVASSEGALFEYGSDEAIIGNLRVLSAHAMLVVGSVTSDQPIRREQIRTTRFRLIPRGLAGFTPLAEKAGYSIARFETMPLSDQVLLLPAR
jgi:hypothetical protein